MSTKMHLHLGLCLHMLRLQLKHVVPQNTMFDILPVTMHPHPIDSSQGIVLGHCCCFYSIQWKHFYNLFDLLHLDIVLHQNMPYNLLLHQMLYCMYQQSRCHNYNSCHSIHYVNLCIYHCYNLSLSYHSFHYVLYQTMSDNIQCSLYPQCHQQMYNLCLNCYTHSNLGSLLLCNSLLLQNTSCQLYMLYMLGQFRSNNIQHYMIYNMHLDHCWCSQHCSDMPQDTQYNLSQLSLCNSFDSPLTCCSALLWYHTSQRCYCHYVLHYHLHSQLVFGIHNTVFLLSIQYLFPKSMCYPTLLDSCSVHHLHNKQNLYIGSDLYNRYQMYILLYNIHCLQCFLHRLNNILYDLYIVIVLYSYYHCCCIQLCNNRCLQCCNCSLQIHYTLCVLYMPYNLLSHQMLYCMYQQSRCRKYKKSHSIPYVMLCIYQNYNHLLLFRLFHYVLYLPKSNSTLCLLYHQCHQQMYSLCLNYYMHSTLDQLLQYNSWQLQNTSCQLYMLYMLGQFRSNNIQHYMIYNMHLDHCWCSQHCSDMPQDTQYNLSQLSLCNSFDSPLTCCSALLWYHTSQRCYCHYVLHYHLHSQLVFGIHNTVFLLSIQYLFPKSMCYPTLLDSCSVHHLHNKQNLYIGSDLYNRYQMYILLYNIHCLQCFLHRLNNILYDLYIVIVLYSYYHCCCIQLCNNRCLQCCNCSLQIHYTLCVLYMPYNLLSHQMLYCMYQQSRCRKYKKSHSIPYVMLCIYQNYNHLLLFHLFHYVPYLTRLNNTLYLLYLLFHQQMYNLYPNRYMHSNLCLMSQSYKPWYLYNNYLLYMQHMLDLYHSNNYQQYKICNMHQSHCQCLQHCLDMLLDMLYNLLRLLLCNSSLSLSTCCSALLWYHTSQHCYYHYVLRYHLNSLLVFGIHNIVFSLSILCQYPMSMCYPTLLDSCSEHHLHNMLIHYIVFVLYNRYCCCCILLCSIHCLLCFLHHLNNTSYDLYIVIVQYIHYHCYCIQLCNNRCLHRYNYWCHHNLQYGYLYIQFFHYSLQRRSHQHLPHIYPPNCSYNMPKPQNCYHQHCLDKIHLPNQNTMDTPHCLNSMMIYTPSQFAPWYNLHCWSNIRF